MIRTLLLCRCDMRFPWFKVIRRPKPHTSDRWQLVVAVAILALTLSACQTTAPPAETAGETVDLKQIQEQVDELLTNAHNSEPPARDGYYLQAALLLKNADENDWARNILGSVDSDMLFGEDFVQYTLVYSSIALEDGAYFLAQRILTNPRLEQEWQRQPSDIVEKLRSRRADLFALLGEAAKSVAERVSLSPYLESEFQRDLNQDALWQTLMMLPETELRRLADDEPNPLLKGWYTLGALSKNNDADLEMQLASIEGWMTNWPDHPASLRLPSDLRLLKQMVEDQPKQVALLLPLSGELKKSGEAVRDGFFAAYYQARRRGTYAPEIRIYDSNNGDINAAYDLAVGQGAELIIGPLDNNKIVDINFRLELPVPTLALNYIDAPYGNANNLYQFSFSREDESKHVAQRAWLEGHRNALILAPESDNGNGKRSAEAFANEWDKLGGTVLKTSFYNARDSVKLTDVIEEVLLVDDSQRRDKLMEQLLGVSSLQFEPRRRQDVDMIFLEAQPQLGRQIKATLALWFAADIPVYATRRIYDGVEDKKNDSIISGVRFSTLPWYFQNNGSEKAIVDRFAKPQAEYSFLYALGVDAYKLYPRLRQLEQVPGTRFYGSTGALHMLPGRKIEQEQMWAQIVDGVAMQLPAIVSEEYVE